MGVPHVHVHRGLLRAAAEEARVQEDGKAGEPLLSDAEPALHRRVAVSGRQRPLVGGRHCDVPGVDVCSAWAAPKGCVRSVRQRMVHLRSLRDRDECLHCGGP